MFFQAVVTQFEHFVISPVLKIRYRGHVLILFLRVTMSRAKVQSRRLNSHFRAVKRAELCKLIISTGIRDTKLIFLPHFNDVRDRKRLVVLVQLQRRRQQVKPDVICEQIPINSAHQQTKKIITRQTQTVPTLLTNVALHRHLLAPDILHSQHRLRCYIRDALVELGAFGGCDFLDVAADVVLEKLDMVLTFQVTAALVFAIGHTLDLDALDLAFVCGHYCCVCVLEAG
jgi:hypothetical protein